MANAFLISDLHLGHKNITKFRPQFTSPEHMRDVLFENWHKVVKKGDRVYILGDVCFSMEALQDLSTWTGEKVLIVGNHDLDSLSMKDLIPFYHDIKSLYKWHEFWLTHCPVHPDELRGKKNIHGHCHDHIIADERYINVCCENVEYTPISISQLRDR